MCPAVASVMNKAILIGPSSSWVNITEPWRFKSWSPLTNIWHREMDPLKVAEKEEIVTKSYACWAGDSYLLLSARRQVMSGFHIVGMSRVCMLKRSLQGDIHFKRSFRTNISSYVVQNIMKEPQILRPGGFRKVPITKALTMEVST